MLVFVNPFVFRNGAYMADIIITHQYDAFLRGFHTKAYFLARIQAPEAPKELAERPPLNLALVIDQSSSMRGHPLREAKRCAEMIIDSLKPTDKASLTVYSNNAELVVPNTPIKNKKRIIQAISEIHATGMTALFDGWKTGANSLPKTKEEFCRVLLLSDGQANRGLTHIPSIKEEAAAYSDKGVTTSTYGLGLNFNEDLMLQLADSGGGNAYYGATADDLSDPFSEEFELISNLYAKELKLRLLPKDGFKMKVQNLYRKDGEHMTRLPNLAYDSEIWALVEISIDPSLVTQEEGEKVDMGTLEIFYKDLSGEEHKLPAVSISLPSLSAIPFKQLQENEVVRGRLQELRAADLQEEASKAVDQRNWAELERLLRHAKENAKNNKWLEDVIVAMERMMQQRQHRELSLELKFGSSKMRKRLAAKHELLDNTDSSVSFLRRKMRQGKKE